MQGKLKKLDEKLEKLGLTSLQVFHYKKLLLFFGEQGHAPTLKEFNDFCAVDGKKAQSLNTIQNYFNAFEKKGLIARSGKKRGLKLIAFDDSGNMSEDALRVLGLCVTQDSIGFQSKKGEFINMTLLEAMDFYENLTRALVIHDLHYRNKCKISLNF